MKRRMWKASCQMAVAKVKQNNERVTKGDNRILPRSLNKAYMSQLYQSANTIFE